MYVKVSNPCICQQVFDGIFKDLTLHDLSLHQMSRAIVGPHRQQPMPEHGWDLVNSRPRCRNIRPDIDRANRTIRRGYIMVCMGQQVHRFPNLSVCQTDSAGITRFLIDNHTLNIKAGEFRISKIGKVPKLIRREC